METDYIWGVKKKNVLRVNNDAFYQEGVAGTKKMVSIALNTLVLKAIEVATE